MITKLISGGQTGADRAALDVALRHEFPHGGWCPKGRNSVDGPIPLWYMLKETPSESCLQRTRWNVRDSDGTVVFTLTEPATGGSLETIKFAAKLGKPCLHLPRVGGPYQPDLDLQKFVERHQIKTLNVAGSGGSKAKPIYSWVIQILEDALFWSDNHPFTLGGPGEG